MLLVTRILISLGLGIPTYTINLHLPRAIASWGLDPSYELEVATYDHANRYPHFGANSLQTVKKKKENSLEFVLLNKTRYTLEVKDHYSK